jgi:hypothetical protein
MTPPSAPCFRRLLASLVLGLTLATAGPAGSSPYSTPRSLGMGGALVAAPTGATALFLNPAGMPLLKGYAIEGFYDFNIQANGHVAHTSVVDSISSKWVSAGLYYNLTMLKPKVFERSLQKELTLKQQGHETGLALALALGQRFYLGTTIKYQFFKAEIDIAGEGGVATPRTVDRINNIGVDVGLVVIVVQGLSLGVTGTNLVPQHSAHAPLGVSVGVAYAYKQLLTAAFDVQIDLTDPKDPLVDYHGGAEVLLSGKYGIRAGAWHRSFTGGTFVTAGFGYLSAKAGLDLFLQQEVAGGSETRIGFSFKVFVQ